MLNGGREEKKRRIGRVSLEHTLLFHPLMHKKLSFFPNHLSVLPSFLQKSTSRHRACLRLLTRYGTLASILDEWIMLKGQRRQKETHERARGSTTTGKTSATRHLTIERVGKPTGNHKTNHGVPNQRLRVPDNGNWTKIVRLCLIARKASIHLRGKYWLALMLNGCWQPMKMGEGQ
jgi:hypothetical protein